MTGFDFGSETAEYDETDLNSLWEQSFQDVETPEQAQQEELPPEGDYQGYVSGHEERPNRFDGRVELYCYGTALNEEGKYAKLRFNLTPKKVVNQNTGRPVWDYVLFSQAVAAFQKVKGGKPSSKAEFTEFLSETTLTYRLVKPLRGGSTMKVMGISAGKGQAGDDAIPF